jgi:hypothetical protein
MAGRFTSPITAEYNASGDALAGGQLFFYETGTTTPLDTYSDDSLSTANANPVVADSAGRWGDIFLKDQDYKVVLKDVDDVTIWTADPVRAAEPTSTTVISKTTTYVVTTGDDGKLIEADATSGAFTITLPTASDAGNGFTITVKKVDSSTSAVTVDADGSETIDGDTDVSLPNQHDVVQVRSNGTQWRVIVQPLVRQNLPLPRGSIDGLILSNNSTDADHDIDISIGMCRDSADGANMILAAAITKRIDAAWAVGDGNGGLDTGSVGNATWYHVWLIRRSDTGVVDALFSTSATAPTMPASYDQKRRIGAVLSDGSANILAFSQLGDEFLFAVSVLDLNGASVTTTASLHVLTVPTGIQVRPMCNMKVTTGSARGIWLSSPDQTDAAPTATTAPLVDGVTSTSGCDAWGNFRPLRTDTSAQIRARAFTSTCTTYLATYGWIDLRGKQ